jgi:hypothetical protein
MVFLLTKGSDPFSARPRFQHGALTQVHEMPESALISRQRSALRELLALLAERAQREPRIEREFQTRTQSAEKDFQERCQQVIGRFESEKESSHRELEDSEERFTKRFKKEWTANERQLTESRRRIGAQHDGEFRAAKAEFDKFEETTGKSLEGRKEELDGQLGEGMAKATEAIRASNRIQREATQLLQAWRLNRDYGPVPEGERPDRRYLDAFRQLEKSVEAAEAQLKELRVLRLPPWFEGPRLVGPLLLAALVLVGLGVAFAGLASWYIGVIGGLLLWVVFGGIGCLSLYAAAKKQVKGAYLPLCQALREIDVSCEKAREQARTAHQGEVATAQKWHDQEMKRATANHQKRTTAAKELRDSELHKAQEKHDQEQADITLRKDSDLRQAHEKYQRLRAEIYERYEKDSHTIHERHYALMTESEQRRKAEWEALAADWHQRLSQFHSVAQEVIRDSDHLFPDWANAFWKNWQPPTEVPPGIRFGGYQVNLADLPGGLSSDERLKPTVPVQYALPALLPFPVRGSLLIQTGEDGKARAVQILQGLMLRTLTSLPPGKVRFTIVDPIGLGENFGSFMHLADADEALVTNRIWTEQEHIEKRLADLTEHMENVLQKYLRDQFETIEEYNANAGEVAEPFRILVVANFPANFSAEAARRLLSIVSSGARCGVYAFVSSDPAAEMPHNFNLGMLEPHTINLTWNGQRFVWKDEDFEPYPLSIDAPPSADFSIPLLRILGDKAKEAGRVEVPFEFIAPPPEKWWREDSRAGVSVALGRAGATKRQHLELGQGTSQHVLLAGKTGSGKSTLLHALITNLSLLYSPEEVELYLIDFKKGVEFKSYAVHELPHARVVAIESEREFGLSVLQALDAELKLRGDRFRQAGAQDLKSFRKVNPNLAVPRILLIVDEFQEFFSEEDKAAQEASALLDRLVRQGRAFGLHVLLGSQTLGGAYTLARSTIDQMAVRIALQCSEADAQLILSDGNTAARLLSRPGEAIYNDANGLVEGNNPFQVVWLPELQRDDFLERITKFDRRRNPSASRQQVVFEGNAPADISKNLLLHEVIETPAWPAPLPAYRAWLGEAMAIKEPTAALFRRQTGSNLLLIGQQEAGARGVLATCLVSLAAQHPSAELTGGAGGARFYVLDASPPDSPHVGYFTRLAKMLPQPIRAAGWRDLEPVLAELTEEMQRRQNADAAEGPALYLILFALHRFRDLRRREDDFSFGQTEEGPNLAKQFATLVREGSALGIHILVWADTYNNLTRSLDRLALREFDMRVLFQMSATDSSNLIDTPLAGKLGLHRAIYYSEEEGRMEKFRPYGLPPDSWLEWTKSQLNRKQAPEPAQEKISGT